MVGLAHFVDGFVVAGEVRFLEPLIVLLLRGLRICALRDAAVVVLEHTGNVDSERAGHAVLAVGAVDHRILLHLRGHALHELQFLVGHVAEMAEGFHVLLKRIHRRHARQHHLDARMAADEAEGPRGHAVLRVTRLHLCLDIGRDIGQAAAQQRFHHHDGNSALVQLGIQI